MNSLGAVRNDWEGWIGFEFTVGSTPLTVTSVGRWVRPGNTGNHVVKLLNANGTDVPNGSATIQTAGQPPEQFIYESLGTPVTLAANTIYFLMSREVNGGDTWYDYNATQITLSADANTEWSVWATTTIPPVNGDVSGGNKTHGPVNLRYSLGSTKLAAPTFSPVWASDHSSVTATATAPLGTIHYTTNNQTPTESDPTAAPLVAGSTTVQARVFQSGYTPSDPTTLPVGMTANVSFSPNGHDWTQYSNGPLPVQMTAESGATIYYKAGNGGYWLISTSGSSPTIDGMDSGNGTIQAYAFTSDKLRSATTVSSEYSFRLPQPTSSVSYVANGYSGGTLTLSAPNGATIRYTSDGTVPTSSSTQYTTPLTYWVPTKIYAKAFKTGYIPSGHVSAWVNRLPTPTIASASGVLSGDTTVDNTTDVWLLPNFGWDNAYGEARGTAGWAGNPVYSTDAPNSAFPGSFVNGPWAYALGQNSVDVSYGRTFSMSGWFKALVAGSFDYAGIANYDGNLGFICAEDINEWAKPITYLTQPLANGATTAYLADETVFSPVDPNWYFNFFVPLANFTRTGSFQLANQPNTAKDLYQPVNLDANTLPCVTSVNSATHSVQLSMAYSGPTLPVGTVIARRMSGSTYQYQLKQDATPSDWTSYATTFAYMRAGTERVQLLALFGFADGTSSAMTGLEFWEGGQSDRPNLYYTQDGTTAVFGRAPVSGPVKLTFSGNSGNVINLGQRGIYYIDSAKPKSANN